MEIKLLKIDDLKLVNKFYDEQRAMLIRKEFFYPYQNDDIIKILNGGGIMKGAFIDDRLVGISAIDFDKNYGKILKTHINRYFSHTNFNVYEYSGVMTDANLRHKGIASALYENLISNNFCNICLCAVVQLENQASLNFFFKKGFRLVSVSKTYNIDFGYLIKNNGLGVLEIDNFDIKLIPSLSYIDYDNLLPKGYVGFLFENGFIKMAKQKNN